MLRRSLAESQVGLIARRCACRPGGPGATGAEVPSAVPGPSAGPMQFRLRTIPIEAPVKVVAAGRQKVLIRNVSVSLSILQDTGEHKMRAMTDKNLHEAFAG